MTPKERRILLVVIVAGVLLRVLHVATSMGSADSLTWTRNVMLTERAGVLTAYRHDPGLNHPPLGLAIARLSSEIGLRLGLEFQDVFRLLQTLADILTTLALARLAGVSAAAFFMLSPAAIFISGFHCQSDPLMTMFVVLAIVARRPAAAGALIALAVGVKVIALVALPLVLLRFRGRAILGYAGAVVVTGAAIFTPAIVASGSAFLQNVFGYTGLFVSWGLNYVLGPTPMVRRSFTLLLLALLVLLWVLELLRRSEDRFRTARVVGTALLLVLVLAPGFGVQYLFWPLPFLALMFRRWEAALLHGTISVFLFAMYTAWSGGWPWWFGTQSAGIAGVQWALAVWIALVAALALSLGRLYARRAA